MDFSNGLSDVIPLKQRIETFKLLPQCTRYNIRLRSWQQKLWHLVLIGAILVSTGVGCAWRRDSSLVNTTSLSDAIASRERVGGGGSQQSGSADTGQPNGASPSQATAAPTEQQVGTSDVSGDGKQTHSAAPPSSSGRRRVNERDQEGDLSRGGENLNLVDKYLSQLGRERVNEKGEYLISVGDLLDMTARDAEELNSKMRVDDEGKIKLPFELGAVRAVGSSCSELTAKIKQTIREGRLYDPVPPVDVVVEEYGGLSIAVLGAVIKPGKYFLSERTTKFTDVIESAGGATEEASGKVYLYRLDGAVRSETPFDLTPILLGLEPGASYPIRGGDVIVVGEIGRSIGGVGDVGQFFFIMGEVNEPGVFELARATTVTQAITIAGGLTNVAKPSEIRVNRPSDNTALKLSLSKVFKGKQEDIWLEAEDVIYVPKDGGKAFALGFVDFWRSIFGVGVGVDYNLNTASVGGPHGRAGAQRR